MKLFISKGILLLFLLNFLFIRSYSQLPYGLKNGVSEQLYCARCQQTIAQKPDEVLFGIDINSNGDVYFSINNREWFDKIFRLPSFGVTADLVSKDRYNCKKSINEDDFLRGVLLKPVYKPEMLKEMEELQSGTVYVKIGKVPAGLLGKELEGNLVIVNGAMICFYTNFVNINRNVWELLPMGLFSDTLLNVSITGDVNSREFFTYSRKIQFEIPFFKNEINFKQEDIKPLYDSLQLKNYSIQKIELRAYSSVEGAEKINTQLMEGRAAGLVSALKFYQPSLQRIHIITAENWLDFFNGIEETKFSGWKDFSKLQIKQKLTDKAVADEMEPLLSKQRKAIITLFLEPASGTKTPADSIMSSFDKAISKKQISEAIAIQKSLFEEIRDNNLPVEYLNKLEVPATKDYAAVLNDKEIYRYLLKATSEYEALQNFINLKKIDPDNGRINYNVCALKFFVWQFGNDSSVIQNFNGEITQLEKQGIDSSLVKRMLINYHILRCYEYNKAFKYEDKDRSLEFIRNTYKFLSLSDEDIYALARYFTNYSQGDWAEEIIAPRISKNDVSEDLVFYYLNLLFFHFSEYESDEFKSAVLNAINLNRQRYCNFFLPISEGGASMQLLENEELKSIYCQNCGK